MDPTYPPRPKTEIERTSEIKVRIAGGFGETELNLSDFQFDLPEERIALQPARPRSSSRLLVATGASISDSVFFDLPNHLDAEDRLVFNDTRVIPARIRGVRIRNTSRGVAKAAVEAMLGSREPDGTWLVLLRPARKVRVGDELSFGNRLCAEVVSRRRSGTRLRFNVHGRDFMTLLSREGEIPLPPYIAKRRPVDPRDAEDYQSVFAHVPGAVAAPTASLHFDQAVLDSLRRKGVRMSWITLHVGLGTFMNVRAEDMDGDRLHSEWGSITEPAATEINGTRERGGRIIPVGTTTLRLLETSARTCRNATGIVSPWCGETDIFIKPGFDFKVSDALITNFHLPNSTLMMLVSAFMGSRRIRRIYAHAIQREYRFYSYGDGSLLVP